MFIDIGEKVINSDKVIGIFNIKTIKNINIDKKDNKYLILLEENGKIIKIESSKSPKELL